MPKDLTTSQVARLTTDGEHRVAPCLYLQVRGHSRLWLLRYRFRGRPARMSLGPERLVTLTEARRKAIKAQGFLLDGKDPRRERAVEHRPATMTFAECAEACIEARKAGWKNAEQHSRHWRRSLEMYAYPVIGKLPVDEVDANHVVKILEPIWNEMIETGTKVRERLEKVLDWAASAGHRSGENPARWRGGLEHRLAKPTAVQDVKHHVAVPVADVPTVYGRLNGRPEITARLLQAIMLTGLRFSEAAKATWSEIDLDADVPVWTIPANRMKMKKVHRVPLSAPLVAILRNLRPKGSRATDFVFAGRSGKPPTDTSVRKLLRKVGPDDADTHGLRSSFRDWVAERGLDGEAAEMALAHKLGDDVTTAYLRSDMFQRRVVLMSTWAGYLTGTSATEADDR